MAHRKIVELTIRTVIDVDNDDLPERQADPDYRATLEARIEDFVDETRATLSNTEHVSVHKAEVIGYNVIL